MKEDISTQNRCRLKFTVLMNTVLAFLFITQFNSCSLDVLDKSPLDSYSDADVWRDPSLISAYISNIYRDFPVDWNTTACLTDEVTRRNNATYDMINSGDLTPGNAQMVNYWYGGTA